MSRQHSSIASDSWVPTSNRGTDKTKVTYSKRVANLL